MKFINEQSGNQCKEDETNQVSAGRTCKLSNPPVKPENTGRPTRPSNRYTMSDGCISKTKYIDTDHDHQVGKTDRYRADWNRNRHRSEDTGDCIIRNQNQFAGGKLFRCCAIYCVVHSGNCLPYDMAELLSFSFISKI